MFYSHRKCHIIDVFCYKEGYSGRVGWYSWLRDGEKIIEHVRFGAVCKVVG